MPATLEAYAEVLRDLRDKVARAQKVVDETKSAIAALEANMPHSENKEQNSSANSIRMSDESLRAFTDRIINGRFSGKSIADAARELLQESGKPMKVADIAKGIIYFTPSRFCASFARETEE